MIFDLPADGPPMDGYRLAVELSEQLPARPSGPLSDESQAKLDELHEQAERAGLQCQFCVEDDQRSVFWHSFYVPGHCKPLQNPK